MTMELVETVTVGGGGASSIAFSSIPNDGQDLVLKMSFRFTSTDNFFYVNLNNNTSTRYASRGVGQSGGNIDTFATTNRTYLRSYAQPSYTSSSEFTVSSMHIFRYSEGLTNVPVVQESAVASNSSGNSRTFLMVQDYLAYGSPISSIQITSPNGNFVAHSTASLYKIIAA